MSSHAHTNRLIHEKSPYLLQHAHNPVDWFPWGGEALAKAKAENKPILVSIGYATCHWCHVMERESFENADVAAYMNENFVCIKVDREERPDVDKVYMDALHAMGEQGGWPLNVFLTPDARPFYGGTYWPPHDMYGRPGFQRVLAAVRETFDTKRDTVESQADGLMSFLQQRSQDGAGADGPFDFGPEELDAKIHRQAYDSVHGGFLFHHNNKFPPSMGLLSLLRMHERTGQRDLLDIAAFTIERMKYGGIYDQLGGGLCRYSTDHQWLVPHFEKMLYDNALWLWVLTALFQITGEARCQDWARDTIAYLDRDMSHPEGAFYSAEDADSEGEEGKFYVWTLDEVSHLLDGLPRETAIAYWGVRPAGTFEQDLCILHVTHELDVVSRELGVSQEAAAAALAQAREQMMAVRAKRVRPLLDDKILTSWNALMISAYTRAGRAFNDPSLITRAEKAMAFIRRHLATPEGRLLRRWREGEGGIPGFLVDHAQLGVAALDLFEATGEAGHFSHALHLAREIQRLFRRPEGAFYDTGEDQERLVVRTMEGYDGVEPSGNAAASQLFLRLHGLTGDAQWQTEALGILNTFRGNMDKTPISHGAMLETVHRLVRGPVEAVLTGPADHPEMTAAISAVNTRFLPEVTLVIVTPENAAALKAAGVHAADGRDPAPDPRFYVCRNQSCQLPVSTAAELIKQLRP